MSFTLDIHNYKCWRDLKIDIHPLTVLCGANNVGKSSIIQALVLMRAAVFGSDQHVPLNGPYGIDLGTVADVVSNSPSDQELILSASTGSETLTCRFDAGNERENDRHLTIVGVSDVRPLPIASMDAFGFTYLCAERCGPRDYQSIQSRPREMMEIGARGEFATDVIAAYEFGTVRSEMVHAQPEGSDRNERLRLNLQLWMQDLFPDLNINATRDLDAAVGTLRYRQQSVESEWMRPSNLGFGISYVLPVILAALKAPAGGILIVENPEAHLHPSGQSFVGSFLVRRRRTGEVVKPYIDITNRMVVDAREPYSV